MRSGEPTEVPPNFITFIVVILFKDKFISFNSPRHLCEVDVGRYSLVTQLEYTPSLQRCTNAPGILSEHWDVTGCHHNSCALLGDVLQQTHDVAGSLRVEISRWLIGDDDFGIVRAGTGDGHTLLLSTGELVRHLVDFLNHAYPVEHLFDTFVSVLLVFPSGSLEHELKVLAHGAVV